MKAIGWIVKSALVMLLLVFIMVTARGIMDARVDYEVSTDGLAIPQYMVVSISHFPMSDRHHPTS